MESHSTNAAALIREELRLLLRHFVTVYDEVDAARSDDSVIVEFIDAHGTDLCERFARIEQELGPAEEVLQRAGRHVGLNRVATHSTAARVSIALKLLKGEE